MSDEAADAIIGLYERTATAWDAARQGVRPDGEAAWIRRLAQLAGPGATVLDIGCGSGEPMARTLIAEGLIVTGVDSSAALIALCRDRFPDQTWLVGDMRTLDLGRTFSAAMAWHSFFHLTHEDQAAMFPVFARHLAPGAPLMFTSGPHHGVAMGEWQGEPLYHASLAPEGYRALLADNGFEVLEYVPEDAATGGATVWLARRLA